MCYDTYPPPPYTPARATVRPAASDKKVNVKESPAAVKVVHNNNNVDAKPSKFGGFFGWGGKHQQNGTKVDPNKMMVEQDMKQTSGHHKSNDYHQANGYHKEEGNQVD
ncbi:hypothetical protein HDV00_002414 [Rhizophlyctis rosea]|nr:hypothetical protein HDV00_002414 [Rhizophlyctis rosea]